jgi:hypothetical protein
MTINIKKPADSGLKNVFCMHWDSENSPNGKEYNA